MTDERKTSDQIIEAGFVILFTLLFVGIISGTPLLINVSVMLILLSVCAGTFYYNNAKTEAIMFLLLAGIAILATLAIHWWFLATHLHYTTQVTFNETCPTYQAANKSPQCYVSIPKTCTTIDGRLYCSPPR